MSVKNKLAGNRGFAKVWMVISLDLIISVVASMFAVFAVRFFSDPFGSLKHFVYVWTVFSALASLLAFVLCGTGRMVIRHSSYRSIGKLAMATMLKEAVMILLIFTGVFSYFNLNSLRIECEVVLVDALLTLVSLVLVRVLIIAGYRVANEDDVESNVGRLGVLVYGTSYKAVAMVTRLEYSSHYNVLGFVSMDRNERSMVVQDRTVHYVESEDDLRSLRTRLGVQCILFADEGSAMSQKDGLIPMCIDCGIHILNSPRIGDVTVDSVSGAAMKEVNTKDMDYIPDGMSDFERIVKRMVDCLLSGLLLVLFSPLFLMCWLALRIGERGPAIYSQERIGRFGRPFRIYKFRSMRLDAEASGPALYSGDDDPRLTRVGKFLRQHHLDELPQLWNVFIGDMAFVGYRPERKFYIDKIMEIDSRYYYLYQIRPGVTSYATLNNGYTDTMDKMLRRLEYDLYYLRHRSWFFDIKVLWMTFCNIVFGKKF